MKNNIKALPLSLALSFLALMGACSSVNSTPNSEVPGESNSVILEGSEDTTEAVEDLSPELDESAIDTDATEGVDSAEVDAVDGLEDETAIDSEVTEDGESAELNPLDNLREDTVDSLEDETAIDTEVTEDGETAEVEGFDGEGESAIDTDATDDVESAEGDDVPEIILPESDSAEVETDSESAENNLVPEIEVK